MFTENQIEEFVDMLTKLDENTKIYFGCDSSRYLKKFEWWAKYTTVAIIHKNGKNGCKIFENISHQRDYDTKKDRPALRLMNEVFKVTELYSQLSPFIDGYETEIHLDINPSKLYGSSCVAQQATGYITGVTQIKPKLKPDSWCASRGADGVGRGYHQRCANI
jgi:predicted RNase H-related nuclease YkuK (DUF458 family)